MSTCAKLTDLPDGHELQTQDFDKRYQNTYLLVEGTPMEFIGREGIKYHFQDTTKQNKPYIWNVKEKPNLDIVPFLPAIGYYNVGGVPIYLYKVPQKQYKRSFCSSIYTSSSINRGLTTRTDQATAWKPIVLEAANPTYALLDEIVKPIFAYVALNRQFAIQTNATNGLNLIYRQYQIGELDFKEKCIQVFQPTFYQEVQDLLKYTGVRKWNLK